ncbi:tubulin-like doman-containing protein [Saccharothrix australiensis]|uniref:Tubulin-like protein n=1 Tax=Saccharothrix australiensis TaxID=2072 RepID=A0A495W401_9PSEU|nr:tubulin-like doman-containing protein [Saccharothrix australiensis]RKT55393.1 tubulin-like protein [Saccharothrix australiensis]
MKIYQPVLFVGLGGTGCLIGAELERRLRGELCGPDGTNLQELLSTENALPYQLPSCLQFVYADLSEDEFTRLQRRVVPGEEHLPAAERTMHLVKDLVPRQDTYPEVARSLRLNAGGAVDWLPPVDGEPRIGPLAKGAGQFPTVGRAALFETLRTGLGPVQGPINRAIGAINKSAGELTRLGGRLNGSCDVFVAFSVAGGTGSGIFYDYLHLVGDALARNGYRARIYPLVLMPSAFDEGLGGGRPARLNAGRALLDLFRLVDDQNSQSAGTELNDAGITGALSVRYPTGEELRLRAGTAQTAFLFSRSAGVEREDLHRSVVSLMLSLIGTGPTEGSALAQGTDRIYQSFADDFVNRAAERELPSPSGIGNRGVSTSLVASLTVPVDELAELVGSRLLAEAVTELVEPPPGRAENNREAIEQFFTGSNLDALRLRAPIEFTEPPIAIGAEAVLRALNTRVQTLESALTALEQQLVQRVPKLAQDFDPQRAAELLLGELDLFRLHRVFAGHPALADPADQRGFARILESRRGEPEAPAGLTLAPPQAQQIRNRLFSRVKWADPVVREAIDDQNRWYKWRARRLWHAAWDEQSLRWERTLRRADLELRSTVDAFLEHARSDAPRFRRRARELYRPRVGVSYLLPPQGGDLEPFYQAVRRRFIEVYAGQGRLRPTATTGELVNEILGAEAWRTAYRTAVQGDPHQAVGTVRDRLKREVQLMFRHKDPETKPLLPALQDLLAAAAGSDVATVGEDDLAQFRQKVAGLVPGGFTPPGAGPMKVLFTYPADSANPDVQRYLQQEVNFHRDAETVVDFRPTSAESMAVVLFRTSMSVTEVPELREVLRTWADAQRRPMDHDFLKWRQRTGYDYSYLATAEEHRVLILHRLLCALWNGQVQVEGDPESPTAIVVRLGGHDEVSMRLGLTDYFRMSSWASVLSAYEEWTLTDDEGIRRDFGARLMTVLPHRVDETPNPPSDLYRTVVKLARDQAASINAALSGLGKAGASRAAQLRAFWTGTFPAALDLPFRANAPVQASLRELEEWMDR